MASADSPPQPIHRRRKLEMKRIDGKNNRLITFSNHTSIEDKNPQSDLRDVNAAVIIFSAQEKLYEYSCTNNSL
ncbi:hypothetical protein R6Q57_026954 [Mikania cordata]